MSNTDQTSNPAPYRGHNGAHILPGAPNLWPCETCGEMVDKLLHEAEKIIRGTARSMGVEVEG